MLVFVDQVEDPALVARRVMFAYEQCLLCLGMPSSFHHRFKSERYILWSPMFPSTSRCEYLTSEKSCLRYLLDNWIIGDISLQSNALTRGPLRVSSALSLIGGVHIGARTLHILNLMWFGYIARLSQWGGGVISTFKWFLPALLHGEEVGRGSAPCGFHRDFPPPL